MIRHCNNSFKGTFQYIFIKPYYRFLEYGVCQNCGKEIFIDFRQYAPGAEIVKEYTGLAAKRQLNYWKNRLQNSYQGTRSKQYFYFGTHTKSGNYFKTYRTNFNNERELLFKQKTKFKTI